VAFVSARPVGAGAGNPVGDEAGSEEQGRAAQDWLLHDSFFSKWLPPKHFNHKNVALTEVIGEEPEGIL